jgi:hypothetical protein
MRYFWALVLFFAISCPALAANENYELVVLGPDEASRYTIAITFGDYPVVVRGGSEDLVRHDRYEITLPQSFQVYASDSFLGLDRGDIGEFDVFAYINGVIPVHKRSKHKEIASDYNAYEPQYYWATGRTLVVDLSTRVTGRNELLSDAAINAYRGGDRLTARPHYALYLYAYRVGEPQPPPPDGSKAYFTLARAGTLPPDYTKDCRGATGMVFDLCKQRQALWNQGYKGPEHALADCRSHLPDIGLSPAEIEDYVTAGKSLISQAHRFITRLPMENEDYPGRSVVRREFYGTFQGYLVAHLKRSEKHNQATQTDPCRQTKVYDNLQGWCDQCY